MAFEFPFPDGRIEAARIVLTGVAPVPWTVPAAERVLQGAAAADRVFARAAEAVVHDAAPLRHNAYNLHLVRVLVPRALEKLAS